MDDERGNRIITYNASPTVSRFHRSNAGFRGLRGPVGSGKTSGCINEIMMRAHAQHPSRDGVRRTRWAAIRNTYGELKSTTIQSWMDWFGENKRIGFGPIVYDVPIRQEIRIEYPDHPVHLEMWFLSADREDHVRKFKSLEVTGVWLNEASELIWAVVEMLDSRHGRYPSVREKPDDVSLESWPTWHGMIGDTNSPITRHWWHQKSEVERPEGWEFFAQPGGLDESAENIGNLPGGRTYYTRMMQGKSQAWIDQYINNQYGSSLAGKRVYTEFNDRLHVSATPLKAYNGLPLRLGWDYGLCYDDQTEVLTEKGWKLFKDVGSTERVATRNPATGEMELHVPAFKVDRQYDGEMLEWVSHELNMCVTPEHLVACRDDHKKEELVWKSAEWLSEHNTGHWCVDVTSTWNPEWVDPVHFGMSAKSFAGLCGLYLSEGCTQVVGNSHRITIYQNNRNQDIQDVLDSTGIDWKWMGSGWRVTNNLIGKWFAGFGLAAQKRVPREIADMPTEFIREFIRTYTIGDGHVRTRHNGAVEHTIFTVSRQMAADMQELAQKAGWNSSVLWRGPQVSHIVEGDAVRAISNKGGFVVTFKKSSAIAGLHKRHFRRIAYSGRIYCLNVPYHTLYVRRGGVAHWNGNTPACIIGQLTPRGQLRILREIVATDMGIERFAGDVVVPFLRNTYPGLKIISRGDPGGGQRAQTDEKTCEDILRAVGIPTEPAPTNLLVPRQTAVRRFLTKLVDGEPAFLLDPSCVMLREGFNGGYHYPQLKVVGDPRYREEPDKNEYSHPHDGLQYLCLDIATELPKPTVPRARTNYRGPADRSAGY